MPMYEYLCHSCKSTFEAFQKITEPVLHSCTLCGAGQVERLISKTSFSLRGGGWYKDGYGSVQAGGSTSSSSPGTKTTEVKSVDDKAAAPSTEKASTSEKKE